MLFKFLGVVLLATSIAAEVPSYFKTCGRKNPNLDACVTESTELIRDKLRAGIPELDIPTLEPLYIDSLPLSQTPALTASAKNVKFGGFSDFEVKSVHVDLENKQFDVVLFFKKVIIDGDYDVKAKIVVPIAGKGPIHIVAEDIKADTKLKFKLIKKNGEEYMFFPTMTTKLDIKDYTADFKPAEGPESPLATAINSAIQGGRKEILESITPSIEEVVSKEVLKVANKICTHFTYNELFPDHE